MRFVKWLIGLCLLPFCVSLTMTLITLLQRAGSSTLWSRETIWLTGGFAFWIFIFFTMPRPMRTYVLAHELTHALWALFSGESVRSIRVSEKGGHVKLSGSNWIITLAPYFFPLYTVLVILLYAILSFFLDLRNYAPFWLACVGLTWAFHLTFTVYAMRQHQPDIKEQGWTFSVAVILFFNLLGFAMWTVAVSRPTLLEFLSDWGLHTRSVWHAVAGIAQTIWKAFA